MADTLLLQTLRRDEMKTSVVWKDGMEFFGQADGHSILMDAKSPIGKNEAPTPKELVAMGLGGCTAMDVIALLKKHKQPPKSFSVEVDIIPSTGSHPIVFEKATLNFLVHGDVESATLIEAVNLSQTKYCGVSAMLAKAFQIEFRINLNDKDIYNGIAKFES